MNEQIRTNINQNHILVTGGAGFIGSHLVEHLVKLGAYVTVIDSVSTGYLNNLQPVLSQIDLIPNDLTTVLQSGQLNFENYKYIFHLAANPYIPPSVENPKMDFEANLQATFMLLDALRLSPNAPRLINASSAAVYGNPVRLPIQETDATIPISPYGVSKLAAERYVAVFSRLYGIQAASLRFFSVYGPRQHKQVVYDLLNKLRANPTCLEILGDGSQARDFTYVLDVVQAMILAAVVATGKGEVYNVASGTTHTIAELATTLCEVCGLTPELKYTGQIRPGDAEKWEVDIGRLKKLGFNVCTSLEIGLSAVRDWYEANI